MQFPIYKSKTQLVLGKFSNFLSQPQERAQIKTHISCFMMCLQSISRWFNERRPSYVGRSPMLILLSRTSNLVHESSLGPFKEEPANKYLNIRDIFVGMYAAQHLQHGHTGAWDIENAVKRACKASARAVERLGAQTSIPWMNEIDT